MYDIILLNKDLINKHDRDESPVPPMAVLYLLTDWLTYLITYLLTYSVEQSPSWEANRLSANQEISRILWNPKVHYRVYKSPPPVPFLSQNNPFHALHPTSWRSILILSCHPRLGLPSGLLPSNLPTKTLYASLLSPHTCHMPRQSRSYQSNNIWWRVQIIKLLVA